MINYLVTMKLPNLHHLARAIQLMKIQNLGMMINIFGTEKNLKILIKPVTKKTFYLKSYETLIINLELEVIQK